MEYTTSSPWEYLVKAPPQGITAPEFLLEKARQFVHDGFGDFNWIVDVISQESFNYKDFDRYTKSIASGLYKKGLRNGDVVIYLNTSIVRQLVFQTGVWRANGVVRSSYPEDTEETFLSRIQESKSANQIDYVLSVKSKAEWPIEIIVNNSHGHVMGKGCTPIEELFNDDGSSCPPKEINADSPAAILPTSGTTGKSKGAVYTHKAFVAIIMQMGHFKAVDKTLMAFKSVHASGLTLPNAFFTQKKSLLVLQTINMENIFKSIDKHKAKALMGFPAWVLGLVNNPEDQKRYDLTSIEICYTAGVTISPAVEESMKQLPNFKHLIILYGMTEFLPVTDTSDKGQEGAVKVKDTPSGSVGKIYPGVQVRILDITSNKWIKPGQGQGEICVRGRASFSYYFNQPKETDELFVDGFLRTGDLGYIDENGFLFVVDRIKDVFKCMANHVSPAEIDGIILSHPAVAECCTIGVPAPQGDDVIPRAFVTLKKGVSANAEEIKDFTNGKLAKYKHLQGGLYIIEELPKGLSGKVTRNLVANLSIPE